MNTNVFLARRKLLKFALMMTAIGPSEKLFAHGDDVHPMILSDSEWLKILSGPQYEVLRLGDTESAGSSDLNAETRAGNYHCVACDLLLFQSAWKFESHTGWPSFWQVTPGHVIEHKINNAHRAPVEYHCAQCGGHQGHVFNDGPRPTGLRYCNNGVALQFKPA